jgi:Family of unknown function (DUF6516)
MDIQIHIQKVDRSLSHKSGVAGIESSKVDRLSENRANIKVRIIFFDGSYLDLREVVDTSKCYPEHLRYGYQYSTSQGAQVFRYDNTPHHPDIQTFPNHKHLGTDDENIVASDRPSLSKIFQEINQYLGMEGPTS